MSDLRVKPDLVQCFITHIESDGQLLVIWAQIDMKSVLKFQSLMDTNYKQLFNRFYKPIRNTQTPQLKKYYVFCDKSSQNFYRVYVISFDPKTNRSNVLFIDFGYEEVVPIDCLFVFENLFFDCKPLAQKFVLADIRPKDGSWNALNVVQSLQKYLRSVLWFAIYEQSDNCKSVSVFDSNGLHVLLKTLSDQFSDEIIIAPNDPNNHLIAIEYNVSTNDLAFNSTDEQNSDFPINSPLNGLSANNNITLVITEDLLGLEENICQPIESIVGQTSHSSIREDKTVCESNSLINLMSDSTLKTKTEWVDNTDPKNIANHLRTLFGPKRMVYITKTLSEKSFYCQLFEDFETIEKITEEMTNFYNKALDSNEYELSLEDMSIDLVIAAMFTEGWYRASVKAVNSAKHKVRVFYIDFGNTESLDLKFCKQLVPQFRSLPPKAIHCNAINKSLGDTLEMFETNYLEIECKFISITGHTLDVELYDKGVVLEVLNESSEVEKNVKFELKVSKESIESKTENLKAIETNRKESNGQTGVENTELDEKIVQHLKQLSGLSKAVLISNAVSAQSFYCRLCESFQELEALIKDMTVFYNKTLDTCNTDAIEAKLRSGNELIAVFSNLEEKWFRAKVCANKDKETVEVFYIDSGNKDIVSLDYCRELKGSYARLHPLAIHCRPLNEVTFYALRKLESNENPIDLTFIQLNEETLVFDIKFKD